MHDFNIWFISAFILVIVVVAKYLSHKTSSIDVLWLISLGALFANIGLIPSQHEVLERIGDWGIVFVMFALGFDENISHFKQGLKRSVGIAIIGAIFPFLASYWTAKIFGYSESVALLWGLTMTATAVSLTMVSLREEQLHKSVAATGIMTAAVIDDILSLIGVAIFIPIAVMSVNGTVEHALNWYDIFIINIKVIIYFLLVLIIGFLFFPDKKLSKPSAGDTLLKKINYLSSKVYTITSIRRLLTMGNARYAPLILLSIAMSMGALADAFGLHPAIGAYLAGLFIKEEYFLIDKRNTIFQKSKVTLEHIAFGIFGPIFFVNLGAKIIFDTEILFAIIPQILMLFTFVFLFQILSAAFAARFTGRYEWHESFMIGFGMLGRAELAFIVMGIAYTDHHIFNKEQFYTLVFATFLLNIAVPLTIKWWKPYYKGEKKLHVFGVKLSA